MWQDTHSLLYTLFWQYTVDTKESEYMRVRFFLFVLLSLALIACDSGEKSAAKSESELTSVYERVMTSGKLRCGYILYPPDMMRDPNTQKFSGIFYELTEELGRRLSLKVEWAEELTWDTFIAGIKAKRYDMLCSGAWSSTAEGREVGYSDPVFYSQYFPYVRAGDKRFDDDLSKLNNPNVRFSVGDGTMGYLVATSDFPLAKKLNLPQLSDEGQPIMNVATGKADVVLQEPYTVALYMKNNPNMLRVLRRDKPVRVFPNRYVMPLGDVKLQSMINTALEEMQNSGFIDPIIAKHEAFPGSFLRVVKPYQGK